MFEEEDRKLEEEKKKKRLAEGLDAVEKDTLVSTKDLLNEETHVVNMSRSTAGETFEGVGSRFEVGPGPDFDHVNKTSKFTSVEFYSERPPNRLGNIYLSTTTKMDSIEYRKIHYEEKKKKNRKVMKKRRKEHRAFLKKEQAKKEKKNQI